MGMHGWKHVNRAIQSADLLFAVGMRFDDRVTGNVRTYAPYARIVHVDIDPAEIGKNVAVEVPIVGDARRVLKALKRMVAAVEPDGSSRLLRPARRVEARLGGIQLARFRRLARRPPVRGLRRGPDRRAVRIMPRPMSPTSARTRCGWLATRVSASRTVTSARAGSGRWASASRRRWVRRSAVPIVRRGRSRATAGSR